MVLPKVTQNLLLGISPRKWRNVAEFSSSYTKLTYDTKGKLAEAKMVFNNDDQLDDIQLKKSGKHIYKKYPVKNPSEFVHNTKGLNYLGGKPPKEFSLPTINSGHPFQYLGMLNSKDATFNLKHDLHLVCPIYLGFNGLWLDYKDPLAPKVVNNEDMSKATNIYGLQTDHKIVYNKIRFSTKPWPAASRHGGHTGVPTWIQSPESPINPKTSQIMELICQLGDADLSVSSIAGKSIIPKKSKRNFVLEEDYLNEDVSEMRFWGSGDLYVFYKKQI